MTWMQSKRFNHVRLAEKCLYTKALQALINILETLVFDRPWLLYDFIALMTKTS